MKWKRLALIILLFAIIWAILGFSVSYFLGNFRDVSILEVVSDPESFNGARVRLHGYVVSTLYMFGPKYVLRDFDDRVEIALGGKGGSGKVDVGPYVSFVFDGKNYTQIRGIWIGVSGHVSYQGPVVDAPSFWLDVEKVEPRIDDVEQIVVEFLKTTDVDKGNFYGTVEIREVYSHKLSGEIVVVDYGTANAVHPHFMCEAVEHHTAVITLNAEREVVSAFCVWGTLHGSDRIWDLINQRWIQK